MEKIFIKVEDCWNFRFDTDYYHGDVINSTELHRCCYCDIVALNEVYCFIINSLKDAGLLNKDYNPICCYCAVLKEFDLLHIRKYLEGFYYLKEEDVLIMHFSLDYHERCDIRIYDYKKLKRLNSTKSLRGGANYG